MLDQEKEEEEEKEKKAKEEMSFVSELGEHLDGIWPLVEEHSDAISAVNISLDMASSYIEVELI